MKKKPKIEHIEAFKKYKKYFFNPERSYNPLKILLGYIRVSTPQQIQGNSPEAQIEACFNKAKFLKLEPVIFIGDLGVSASKANNWDDRKSFQRICTLLETGKAKNIFVLWQSRGWRDFPEKDMLTKALETSRGCLYFGDGSILNFAKGKLTPDEELKIDVTTAVDKRTAAVIREQFKVGRDAHIMKGKYIGGLSLNYGWTYNRKNPYKKDKEKDCMLVHFTKEMKWYLKMVDWFLDGMGCKSIAKRLNELKVPTKNQTQMREESEGIERLNKESGEKVMNRKDQFKWASPTIQRIFKNPIYKGKRKVNLYEGKKIVGVTFVDVKPMISEKKWNAIQHKLSTNKAMAKRNNSVHFYLLSKKMRCECGKNLHGQTGSKYKRKRATKVGMREYISRKYVCSSKDKCGNKPIDMFKLDTLVWDVVSNQDLYVKRIVAYLYRNDMQTQIEQLRNEVELLNTEMKSYDKKREKLFLLYDKDAIDVTEFKSRDAKHKADRDATERKLRNAERLILSMKDNKYTAERLSDFVKKVSTKANSYTQDDRQMIIRELLSSIFVRWDKAKEQHEIKLLFRLGDTQKCFKLDKDGSYKFNPPTFNKEQFGGSFHPEGQPRKVLCEKYEKGEFTLGDLSANSQIVERPRKP